MPGEDRPLQSGDRNGVLVSAGGADEALPSGEAEDLVRQVTELYGAALRRIMQILQDQGKLDDATMDALIADELVSGLLLVHGLHPHSLEARVAAALNRMRPYLGSHGGEVELEGISPEGVVRLKLLGTYEDYPSSSATLRSAVESAIEAAAPEVSAIDVVAEEKQPTPPRPIPVDSLIVRENSPTPATPATSWHDMSGGTWEPVPEIAGLASGEVAAFLIAGYPVVACRAGQDIHAYRDFCPRCTGSMAGAALRRAVTEAAGGSLLSCPTCRGHFDVRRAGACLEDKGLHLDSLPLLVRGGVLSVAVPSESEQGPPVMPVPAPPAPTEVTPVEAIPLVAPAGTAQAAAAPAT
jgi:Fe-S cluster biogenesis protein NfuA/nitrite reductase/ring-hydroxylating ferredoxin subunit